MRRLSIPAFCLLILFSVPGTSAAAGLFDFNLPSLEQLLEQASFLPRDERIEAHNLSPLTADVAKDWTKEGTSGGLALFTKPGANTSGNEEKKKESMPAMAGTAIASQATRPSILQSANGYAANLNAYFGKKDLKFIMVDQGGRLIVRRYRDENDILTYIVSHYKNGQFTITYGQGQFGLIKEVSDDGTMVAGSLMPARWAFFGKSGGLSYIDNDFWKHNGFEVENVLIRVDDIFLSADGSRVASTAFIANAFYIDTQTGKLTLIPGTRYQPIIYEIDPETGQYKPSPRVPGAELPKWPGAWHQQDKLTGMSRDGKRFIMTTTLLAGFHTTSYVIDEHGTVVFQPLMDGKNVSDILPKGLVLGSFRLPKKARIMHLKLYGLSHDGTYANGSIEFQYATAKASWWRPHSLGIPVRWNTRTGEIDFLANAPVNDCESTMSKDGTILLCDLAEPKAISPKPVLWREGKGITELPKYIAELGLTIPGLYLKLSGISRDGRCVSAVSHEEDVWLFCSGTENPFQKRE